MSSVNGNGCCDENPTQVQPPFSELRKGRKTKGLKLFELENPIPAEITDERDIERLFEEWKLVPFATRDKRTGHALLYWYLMLAQLSPMNAACIEKVKKYVVGSRAIVERREDSEFETTGEQARPVTAAESQKYRDALNEMVEFQGGLRKFSQNLQWSYDATGNAFVEASFAVVNGQYRFSLKYRKTTEVLYKWTRPGEMRIVAICPVWTADYMKKFPPVLLPLSEQGKEPVWFQDETGVFRTVFHLKAGQNKWYGRPESEGADLYKYREVQDSVYLIRQAAGNFVGQLIIEVEDDDPTNNPAINDEEAKRAGFDSFVERMEHNYTNKGEDPSSVIITARPLGSRPMFVFQVKPNTNENWYKVTGEMSEQKILRAHGLTLRFMGFDASMGFSSDTFIADYVMNVEPVLNEKRNTLMGFLNNILTAIWQTAGREELNEFSINFRSPIASQIEQFKTMQGQQQNGASNNTNGGGGAAVNTGGA